PLLLARYAARHRVPLRTTDEWTTPAASVVRLFRRRSGGGSAYDAWMHRLHHFLKEDEGVQAQVARRMWSFPPRSMWLLYTHSVAHGWLRGQFALDHSYFVPQDCLTRPAESPLELLAGAGATTRRAG